MSIVDNTAINPSWLGLGPSYPDRAEKLHNLRLSSGQTGQAEVWTMFDVLKIRREGEKHMSRDYRVPGLQLISCGDWGTIFTDGVITMKKPDTEYHNSHCDWYVRGEDWGRIQP